jgi:GTPase
MDKQPEKCGYVALVGKPNVGKSTLMNALLGRKVSITSRKPQTTRQRIIGIKTTATSQMVFVDTPGVHAKMERELNRYMNKVSQAALHDVDVILFMVDSHQLTVDDKKVLKLLTHVAAPVILVINKIDRVKDKKALLPVIEELSQLRHFSDVVPISAIKSKQLDVLDNVIEGYLPDGEHFYPPEQFAAQSDQFIITEFIREKLLQQLGEELPHLLTVGIEIMAEEDDLFNIAAIIWVDKDSHKPMVIGKQGKKLKAVGTAAREDLERYFDKKVMLRLWVKVKSGWSDDKAMLGRFGFDE